MCEAGFFKHLTKPVHRYFISARRSNAAKQEDIGIIWFL
jgi:hypothetical protein